MNGNNNPKHVHDTSKGQRCSCENLSMVKGIAALVAGGILIILTGKLIVKVVAFGIGVFLVYYGLGEIGFREITDYINKGFAKIRGFLDKYLK